MSLPTDVFAASAADSGSVPERRGRAGLIAAAMVVMLALAAGAVTAGLRANGPASPASRPNAASAPSSITPTPRRITPDPTTATPRFVPPTAPRATPPTTSQAPAAIDPARPPASGGADWAAAAAAVDPGVVDIMAQLPGGIGAGTGIVLTASGNVITNNHVIEGASRIEATIATTGEAFSATVVGTDPTNDIAVLHLAGARGLAVAPIGNSDAVKVGDPVAAIGNAGGTGGQPAVAGGHVTALHQPVTASDPTGGSARTLTDLIQVDANVQPGDSGGPLVAANSTVIGINVAASAPSRQRRSQSTEGFAIPINRAMAIASRLESATAATSGQPAVPGSPALGSGFLGVQATDSSAAAGATIASVQAASPASDAGLRAGDVITAIDQTSVGTAAELRSIMAGHKGGDQVTVAWTAPNGPHARKVTLGSR